MKKSLIFCKIFLILNLLNLNLETDAIETKLIAKVGDQIISSYDLENKIKTLLFLNNQELNQSNIDIAKNQALRMLIDNKIKKEEIDKYNFTFKKNDVLKKNLENIALSYNTNLNGLKIFENNINFEIYAEEIKMSLLWNNLIFQLYGNKVNLNEEKLKKFKNN